MAGILGVAAGVPGQGSAVVGGLGSGLKRIQWDGAAWRVDDLRIRLKQKAAGIRDVYVPFELKDVSIADDHKWLVAGTPRRQGDSMIIPLSIHQGANVAPSGAPGPAFGTHPSDLIPRQSEPRETFRSE